MELKPAVRGVTPEKNALSHFAPTGMPARNPRHSSAAMSSVAVSTRTAVPFSVMRVVMDSRRELTGVPRSQPRKRSLPRRTSSESTG